MERLIWSRYLFVMTIWLYIIAAATSLVDFVRSTILFLVMGILFIAAHLLKP